MICCVIMQLFTRNHNYNNFLNILSLKDTKVNALFILLKQGKFNSIIQNFIEVRLFIIILIKVVFVNLSE